MFRHFSIKQSKFHSRRNEEKTEVRQCSLSVGAQAATSSLVSKNIKVNKVYRSKILPVDLYGCETWSLTLREEHRPEVFENRVLRGIFWA